MQAAAALSESLASLRGELERAEPPEAAMDEGVPLLLIVDADEELRDLLAAEAERQSLAVAAAASPAEARELWQPAAARTSSCSASARPATRTRRRSTCSRSSPASRHRSPRSC